MASPDPPTTIGYYSILRYVPDPIRGEALNLGLFLVDADGEWARFEASPRKGAIEAIGSSADVDRIESWTEQIRLTFDLEGQRGLLPKGDLIRAGALREWSASFGGTLQLTDPKVVVGPDMQALWDQLYGRLVRRSRGRRERTAAVVAPRSGREERQAIVAELRDEVADWATFDEKLFRTDATFRGIRAEHFTDVAFLNHSVRAVANVIPVTSGTTREVITARALLAEAALDLDPTVAKLALVDEPPPDRADVLAEVAAVFGELPANRRVRIVQVGSFHTLEAEYGSTLFG